MIKRPRKWCIQKKTYFDKQYFIRRLVIIPQAGAFHGVLQIFDRIRKDKLEIPFIFETIIPFEGASEGGDVNAYCSELCLA